MFGTRQIVRGLIDLRLGQRIESGARCNKTYLGHLEAISAVQEIEKGDDDIVGVDMHNGMVHVDEPKQKVDLTKFTDRHKFVFDDSLDHSVSNDVVYAHTVQPLVHTIFKQGKATCFAYGQTGSGKTYTMSPLPPRAAAEILTLVNTPTFEHLGLFVSCFEIYGNKVLLPSLIQKFVAVHRH